MGRIKPTGVKNLEIPVGALGRDGGPFVPDGRIVKDRDRDDDFDGKEFGDALQARADEDAKIFFFGPGEYRAETEDPNSFGFEIG